MPTCDDWLAVLEPRLTAPLFEPGAVRRLRSLAQQLPGEGQGVLEVRLAAGSAPIDLSLRLTDRSQAHDLAARISPPHLADFLRSWSDPAGPFARISSVWLELDLDRAAGGIPEPVACARVPAGAGIDWVLETLLPALHGAPLAPARRALLARCCHEIPVGASLLYVFSLRARGLDAVRLEFFWKEPAAVAGYLSRVAPRADPRAAQLAPLFAGVERVHLSFDVAEEVAPRIGLEGSYARLPHREPGWPELLGRLVDAGLCLPDKRDALLAWSGYDSFWTAPRAWPVAAVGARGFCARALSHVKVVCQPDRALEAKAYLAFEYLSPEEKSGRDL